MARPVVCIVEGYSSGALFADELEARGVDRIHVQLEDPINPYDRPTFKAEDYVANLVFDGSFERLRDAVAAHRPVAVIPGAETGVTMADRLAEALGVATNGTARSAARRDKLAMQQIVAAAGLRAIPTRAAATWAELERWLDELGPRKVVLKPPASAGTDHVVICATREEARNAFHATIGKVNALGLTNETVIAQPYIVGEEYAVDTASRDGRHQVTSLWHQHKVHGEQPVYDYSELIDPRGVAPVVDYVFAVLDALGIRFGPAHTEVLVDGDGPVLIESGARCAGGKPQVACKRAFGFSQITIALDAYLAPDAFFARMASPYRFPPHVRRVWLASPRAGTLVALPHLDAAGALASSVWVKLAVAIGQPIARTVDLETLPGWIDLVHDDPAVIDADFRQIRRWEADDFYTVDG